MKMQHKINTDAAAEAAASAAAPKNGSKTRGSSSQHLCQFHFNFSFSVSISGFSFAFFISILIFLFIFPQMELFSALFMGPAVPRSVCPCVSLRMQLRGRAGLCDAISLQRPQQLIVVLKMKLK